MTKSDIKQEIEELEELVHEVTELPWERATSNSFSRIVNHRYESVFHATTLHDGQGHIAGNRADWDYLIKAANMVPALIARIRELEERSPKPSTSLTEVLAGITVGCKHCPRTERTEDMAGWTFTTEDGWRCTECQG